MFDLPPLIETLAPDVGAYAFRDESILGTRLQLQLVAGSQAAAHEAALAVRAEIDRLDLILSGWRDDSELAALNRHHRFVASPELFAVIALAERWRVGTHGSFSPRLGHLIDAWRTARTQPPARDELRLLAQAAAQAHVILDPMTHLIVRPAAVRFALDGLAKGWIVDRAFEFARKLPGIAGALIDIGGEIRVGGAAPSPQGWLIGIPDPHVPYDNAPLIATATLTEHAIATSGQGPRDFTVASETFSTTLSPHDGWPIATRRSASVIADSAATADALATAALVMDEMEASTLIERHGGSARMDDGERVHWTRLARASDAPMHFVDAAVSAEATARWQDGWQALATFTAPRRQLIRDPQFRSPYVAMWITDRHNHPIRTLLLVGKRADWQKDNFIWWSMNRTGAEQLVATRSMSTSAAGTYNVFWDGVDDAGQRVPAGTYVLHVETSRERGKHTHRSLTLDFGQFARFVEELPPSEEGGGLRVSFDRY